VKTLTHVTLNHYTCYLHFDSVVRSLSEHVPSYQSQQCMRPIAVHVISVWTLTTNQPRCITCTTTTTHLSLLLDNQDEWRS